MREVVLDTETTGRSVAQAHRVVSLGVVEMIHGRITGQEREWFFDPGRKCDPEAYAVHGLSDAFLARQAPFSVHRREIEAWIGDDVIVAHHAPFDRGFLNNDIALTKGLSSLTDTDRNRFPASQWRDSLTVARKQFPKQPNGLDALADRFGIDRAHRVKHGALKDARILAEVWIELCCGGQGGLFDALPEMEVQREIVSPPYDYAGRKPPKTRLTSAELARWQEVWFAGLGENAVWRDYVEVDDEARKS